LSESVPVRPKPAPTTLRAIHVPLPGAPRHCIAVVRFIGGAARSLDWIGGKRKVVKEIAR